MQRRYLAVMLLLISAACSRSTKEISQTPTTAVQGSTLEVGTTLSLVLTDSISSVTNQVGDVVPALVSKDVKDQDGNVVIPSGAEAQLKITGFQPPMPNQDDGRALLEITGAKSAGKTMSFASPATSEANVATGSGVITSVRADVAGGLVNADSSSRRDLVVKLGTKVAFKLNQPVTVVPG
jgi:hypothetical protein